jgi:UrcA family protein
MKNLKNSGVRPQGRALGCAASAVFLAAAALAGAAFAETPNEVRVNVRDLNLQTPAGAQALLRRVSDAANQVCGGEPLIYNLGDRQRFRRCRAEAIARAVRDADTPMVTALAHRSAEPLTLAGR